VGAASAAEIDEQTRIATLSEVAARILDVAANQVVLVVRIVTEERGPRSLCIRQVEVSDEGNAVAEGNEQIALKAYAVERVPRAPDFFEKIPHASLPG